MGLYILEGAPGLVTIQIVDEDGKGTEVDLDLSQLKELIAQLQVVADGMELELIRPKPSKQ